MKKKMKRSTPRGSSAFARNESMSNPRANDTSSSSCILDLCESLWVNIISFLTFVDINNIKPITSHTHSSASKEEEEQSLRYTCKDLRQILTSEEYYQAKVMETFERNYGDARCIIDEWPSAESVGGWRALYYNVLSIYFPLEGWCTLCESWPWGLVLRCGFHGRCFRGDLVRVFQGTDTDVDTSDSQSYHITSDRIFEISFGKDGEAKCNMFGMSVFAKEFGISFEPVKFHRHDDIFPRKLGGFTFHILWHIQDDGDQSQWSERTDLLPFISSNGVKLVGELRKRSHVKPLEGLHRIRLEPLGHLSETLKPRTDPCQASAMMPSLKSGLYVGDYGCEVYGQFRHEIVHILYLDAKMSNNLQATFGNRLPDDVDCYQDSILLVARKITGDIHVPTGEITWFVDVTKKSRGEPPEQVKDVNGISYSVIKSWSGFGTLASYYFGSPSWDEGWLLQLHDGHFAFCWESFRSQEITILYEFPTV